eukprot:767033-Hanusia_phi.AAC.7
MFAADAAQRELEDHFSGLPTSVQIDVTILVRIAILFMCGKISQSHDPDEYIQDANDVEGMEDHMDAMKQENSQEFQGNQGMLNCRTSIFRSSLDQLHRNRPNSQLLTAQATESLGEGA